MTINQDVQTKSIIIGDDTVSLRPIKFSDIHAGDVIAHEVEGQDLWIGKVRDFAKNSNEWYGNGRIHAVNLYGKHWGKVAQHNHDEILVAAEWHGAEPGHRLWLVESVEIQRVELDGITLDLRKIEFDSIREGDTIVHMVESEGYPVSLWLGTVERKSEVSDQWYGTGRKQSEATIYGNWRPSERDDRADVLIAAGWHATEPGHSLWVVLEG